MLGNKETVFMIIHLLEKEVGFKIDEEYEVAAGIGAGNGILLYLFYEKNGDSLVLVAVDTNENDAYMINRLKVFENAGSYDIYVDNCRHVNGFFFAWNDWNFALNMYKGMDCRHSTSEDEYDSFDY